jgi:hypothetical protein
MKKHDLSISVTAMTVEGPLFDIVAQTKKGRGFMVQQWGEDAMTPTGERGKTFVSTSDKPAVTELLQTALCAGLTIEE